MPGGELLLIGAEVYFSDRRRCVADSRSFAQCAADIDRHCRLTPHGIEHFGLVPVDVAGELARARAGFAHFDIVELVEPGAAILEQIISTLRTSVRKGQPFGVHCVVARGSFIEGNTYLWPVKPDNTFDRVDGSSFCQRLRELAEHPLLIRLITCQSGDGITTDNGAPAAIRPCLAEASVPAVIAMRLIERLVPALCQELQHHGIIDAAMTVARGTVRDLPDSWMPTLYSRLKSGRIWYVPSFADG